MLISCVVLGTIIFINTVIVPKNKYKDAIALMEAGKYQEAIAAFEKLGDYKDSQEQATAIYEEHREQINFEKMKTAKVGDYVIFGSYEQDNDISNGAEGIEWKVLEVKDGKMLLLSKCGLDCQSYNKEMEDVTWETCNLRTWLNDTFLNKAFTEKEKAVIPIVTVSADNNPKYNTSSGNSTQDQIFLLSIAEANQYFSLNAERVCEATAYAEKQGGYVDANGASRWWLRSPGVNGNNAADVYRDGAVNARGRDVNYGDYVVRPALWVDLNSEIF